MNYVGIDNGLDGGIVSMDETGIVHFNDIMPVVGNSANSKRAYDVSAMVRIIRVLSESGRTKVFIERAQAMPGNGGSSIFSIGYGFGLWTGILTALSVPFEIVGPRTWQKVLFSGVDKTDTKKASALVAARLSPKTDWRATDRSKKPHDGKTDAFCIAEYGRMKI